MKEMNGVKALNAALSRFYTEAELRKVVPGTRQNLARRLPAIKRASGVKVGLQWFYHRETLDAFLAARAKHSPVRGRKAAATVEKRRRGRPPKNS